MVTQGSGHEALTDRPEVSACTVLSQTTDHERSNIYPPLRQQRSLVSLLGETSQKETKVGAIMQTSLVAMIFKHASSATLAVPFIARPNGVYCITDMVFPVYQGRLVMLPVDLYIDENQSR